MLGYELAFDSLQKKNKPPFECWTVLVEGNCWEGSGWFSGRSIPFGSLEWNNHAVVSCHITTDKMLTFNNTKPMNLNSRLLLILCICIINV